MAERKHTSVKAFTLIEILIVITMLSIISSVLLVDFNSGRIAQELENAGQEVASTLREAQNYALTGYQGIAGTEPCRFQVSWSGGTYVTTYWYKDSSGNCSRSSVLQTATLRNGAMFSGSDNFYFTLPHAIILPASNKAVVFTKAGSSQVVCVSSDGLISNHAGSTCP